jgi:beta-glucosidase
MNRNLWLTLLALGLTSALACSSSDNGGGAGTGGGGTGGLEQPTIGVRSASILTVDGLQFKDSNGNGQLDSYEDWRLSPDERAEDLLSQMSEDQRIGLMAHATTSDAPSLGDQDVSAELQAMITGEQIRYGLVTAKSGPVTARAIWANNVQELCESEDLGIPFVLSLESAHSNGGGRTQVAGFSRWPTELGLGADTVDRVRTYGEVASKEYRAVGIRMALSVPADLATELRWHNSQFTFGEDSTQVGEKVSALVEGLQGAALSADGVAAAVGQFPGAGPGKDGWDARLEKGTFLSYPGDNIDAHLSPFASAFDSDVAAVTLTYGILESGAWSGLNGLLDGSSIDQVGASFNDTIVEDVLRNHYEFDGLVMAPAGVLEDAGVDPLGAPWGVEDMTEAERAAKAVNAGVDQFAGVNDVAPIAAARTAGDISPAQVDAAAARALKLMFELGLFENPYVEPNDVSDLVNTTESQNAGYASLYRSIVLLTNEDKPDDFLNGAGDGSQTGDPGNAGNGSGKVLPAPPGQVYVAAGCSYYLLPPSLDDPKTQAGNIDWDFVVSNSAGYGELTNFVEFITDPRVSNPVDRPSSTCPLNPADTQEKQIACSNYVFVFIDTPYTADPDSGSLELSEQSLEYATNDNSDALDLIQTARDAIDTDWTAFDGFVANTQIIVVLDAGRASVVDEVLAPGYGVSGLFMDWGADSKAFLDVAFGHAGASGKLPIGVAASDAAAAAQLEDVAGDGQHSTFVEGFGLELPPFR